MGISFIYILRGLPHTYRDKANLSTPLQVRDDSVRLVPAFRPALQQWFLVFHQYKLAAFITQVMNCINLVWRDIPLCQEGYLFLFPRLQGRTASDYSTAKKKPAPQCLQAGAGNRAGAIKKTYARCGYQKK